MIRKLISLSQFQVIRLGFKSSDWNSLHENKFLLIFVELIANFFMFMPPNLKVGGAYCFWVIHSFLLFVPFFPFVTLCILSRNVKDRLLKFCI